MISWLNAAPFILYYTLLIPFLLFWGLSFAHHVGLLILAHLTKSPFPGIIKHPLLILSVIGSLDANLEWLTKGTRIELRGWQGDVGSEGEKWVVGICLALAVAVYSHFVWEVVGDICEFYDIK